MCSGKSVKTVNPREQTAQPPETEKSEKEIGENILERFLQTILNFLKRLHHLNKAKQMKINKIKKLTAW